MSDYGVGAIGVSLIQSIEYSVFDVNLHGMQVHPPPHKGLMLTESGPTTVAQRQQRTASGRYEPRGVMTSDQILLRDTFTP